MAHSNLSKAKKAKSDEFYTQMSDIANELNHYRDQLRGKVIFCNCDDPFESNFFRFFAENFNALGIKRLIATSYKPSPIANTQLGLFGDDKTLEPKKGRPKVNANAFLINEVEDLNGDGAIDRRDIAEKLKENKKNEWRPLQGDGDFRSPECRELLKQADIVITNPPFSLFIEYVAQLVEHDKKFLIIGNTNAITYKEIFKLIKENKFRTGYTKFNVGMFFEVPNYFTQYHHIDEKSGKKIARVSTSCWYTNMDVAKHHQNIPLYKKYTPEEYPHYDNYDAIEVAKVAEIPADYGGAMGVPITFLDKYNPQQFQLLGASQRGCHDELPDTKKYDDYWEMRQDGTRTGSSGGKTNENANLLGNDGKKNYFINKDGRVIQSAYQRLFIRQKN
ncbi:adenine-specific methyltransferase EcoRI family protein [Candidatus Parcubacteria bacterium]|nr:adenine-specific methyltransferase EcoRI family protein [Candidatus Parcubacteria bacterium]